MAADVYTWVMSDIVARWREHTGKPSTSDISDANVHKEINDYYQEVFPLAIDLDLLNGFFTQATSVDDSGQYTLGQTVLRLDAPVTVNNSEIEMYYDNSFFVDYAEDEQFITAPGLAIGATTTQVAYDAFSYDISGNTYSASASEAVFSGLSTVPQNKYGAFSLKISTAGTVTIAEASANATGYNTPGLAVDGLGVADSDSAYMGYVTVISTAAAGFIPGTTGLDAGAVTDTYTDGKASNRGDPQAAFLFNGILYLRPKADRVMQIKAPTITRPDSIDTGVPLDIAWGPLIALGSAILHLIEEDADSQRGSELARIFEARKNSLDSKQRKQRQPQYSHPSF